MTLPLTRETRRRVLLVLGSVIGVSVLLELIWGIGFPSIVADEFRLRFLPMDYQPSCEPNATHLEPLCNITLSNSQVRVAPWHLSINSAGFRGREYAEEKGDDTFRVFVLGDSFTFGVGVDNEETYPAVLEQMLASERDGVRFEVLNLGKPGANTDEEYDILRRFARFDPDLVIIQTLANDIPYCQTFWDAAMRDIVDGRGPLYELLAQGDNASLEETQRVAAELVGVRYHWGQDIRLFVEQHYELYPRERQCACITAALSDLGGYAQTLGASLVIYEISSLGDTCVSADDVIDRSWLTEDTMVVEHGGLYLTERQYQLSRLDIHPNIAGHAAMAEELLPHVLQAFDNKGEATN